MHFRSDRGFMVRKDACLTFMILLSALLFSATASGQGILKKTFPKLGGYQIGGSPFDGYSDPEYQKAMSKLDYVILGSAIPSINEDARAIRAINPDIILAKYTNMGEVWQIFEAYQELRRNKVYKEKGPNSSNALDWWARDAEGNQVSKWPNNWTVNITHYVQPDASGDRYPQWVAKLDYDLWLKHDVWDAVYEDSVYWNAGRASREKPIDWSGGIESSYAKIQSAYRLGHQAYWNQLRKLMPNKYIFVNHDWYLSEEPSALGRWDLPEYDRQVDGGLLEGVLKSSDLVSPRKPWAKTLHFYRRSIDYFRDPAMIMFVASGEPDNYRFFRLAFATCLLDDGYFDYAPTGSHQYGTVEWFDEFDLAGRAGTDWLGLAVDAPPTSAWKSGVWRRDFQGGIALVNPYGNGAVTVTVESGFKRIAGVQDPKVNNGKVADSITLQDGDGIILVRVGAVPEPVAPKPPVLRAD